MNSADHEELFFHLELDIDDNNWRSAPFSVGSPSRLPRPHDVVTIKSTAIRGAGGAAGLVLALQGSYGYGGFAQQVAAAVQRFREEEHGNNLKHAISLGGSCQCRLGSDREASHHEDEQLRQHHKQKPPAPPAPAPMPPSHGTNPEINTCRLAAALHAEGLNAFIVHPRPQRPQDEHVPSAQVQRVCGPADCGQRGCGEVHPYGESPACWRSRQPYLLVLPAHGRGSASCGAAAAGGPGGTALRAAHADCSSSSSSSNSSSPITQGIRVPVGGLPAAALEGQLKSSTTAAPVVERTAHGVGQDDSWSCISEAALSSAGAAAQLQPSLPLTPCGPQRGPMRPSPAVCPCCRPHLSLEVAAAATTPATRSMATRPSAPRTPLAAPEVVVVEPALRAMFTVSPATAEYNAVLEQLPEVWVGPRSALLELAGRMCGAMALSFRCQGLGIPPWRRREAVLSRWEAHLCATALPLEGVLAEGPSPDAPGLEQTTPGPALAHGEPAEAGATLAAGCLATAQLPRRQAPTHLTAVKPLRVLVGWPSAPCAA